MALSSLVGRRVAIRPKRRDDWAVTPNLWGGVVGRPGYLKSPALREAMAPICRFAAEAGEAHASARLHWEQDREIGKAQDKARRHVLDRAAKEGSTLEELRKLATEVVGDLRPEPNERRFFTNGITVEKLGELLAGNPSLLIFRERHGMVRGAWVRGRLLDGPLDA